MSHYYFTSESVTEGHPDKICDQISDAVLDAILSEDPMGRVACETTASTGLIHIMGEISTSCYVDIQKIARGVVREIGYDRAKYGFDCDTCGIIVNIDEQSEDIALGTNDDVGGAGDQGMMFGYACDETPELMPMAISLAHKLARRLTAIRKEGLVDYLRPDGKTQVTVEYDEDRNPVRVDTVVISTQHAPDVSLEQIREDMIRLVIQPTIPAELLDENTRVYVNPTGRFVIGGPQGDTGLTGRKIIVLAKRCQIQLAYAIGVAKPVSILVETFGTGKVSDAKLSEAVSAVFDFRPGAIIRDLDLRRPIYRQLAAYGHMGREDLGVAWEQCTRTEELRVAVGL